MSSLTGKRRVWGRRCCCDTEIVNEGGGDRPNRLGRAYGQAGPYGLKNFLMFFCELQNGDADHFRACFARHCDGVCSVTFLKLVLKVDFELKPTVSEISRIVWLVVASNSQASRMRHWFT